MSDSKRKMCKECGKLLPAGRTHGHCPACLMGQAFASRTMNETAGAGQAPPPSPEEIAGKFPQYEVTECLGRGGMGVVYKARQKSLDRWVAIKILAPGLETEERFGERFSREAQTLAKLSHPNIVTVFDHGETSGLFYIVMEYVDGVNLRDLLRDGKMAPEQALAIVPPVCEALEFAHGKGVVHRDIKPENLLLDRDGRVKIADFGIASLVGAGSDRAGTPAYMAPEQENGGADRRTDVYALGVVLYEMLTGERPAADVVVPSRKIEVDVRIDEMVLRALEKEPERRYQTAGEFRTVVETVVKTRNQPDPAPGRSESRGRLWFAGMGFIVMICLIPPVLLRENVTLTLIGLIILEIALLAIVLRVSNKGPRFRWAAVSIWVASLVACLVVIFSGRLPRNAADLAKWPQSLKDAPTERVIAAALAELALPWAWQELERRPLSQAEADRTVNGLIDGLSEGNLDGPLTSAEGFVRHLKERGQLDDGRAAAFCRAVQGELRLGPLPRLRSGDRYLPVLGEWRYIWQNSVIGMEMMNELTSVKVNGQAVEVDVPGYWNNPSFSVTVPLPDLEPGTHVIEIVVRSGLAAEDDLLGLSRSASSADWPASAETWDRTAKAEFRVFGPGETLVELTEDPDLDPVKKGALSVDAVVVQANGDGVTAVVSFGVKDPPVAVCFDVLLQLGDRDVPCGTFWAALGPDGSLTTSGQQLRVDLDRLDPALREATLVLSPQTEAIEERPTVDRIWGGQVVFEDVPVRRLDGAPSGG